MRPPKYRINLTGSEKRELEQLIRRHTTPQNKARRAQIILLANEEAKTNKEICKRLGINMGDVTRWTKRWVEQAMQPVEERLSDLPRPGAPDRITAEQWCQIMALACEAPEAHGLPITHWTHKELAQAAVKQGIVDTISPSHVGNVLKKRLATPSKPLLVERQTR